MSKTTTKVVLLLVGLLCTTLTTWAQSITVRGTIYGSDDGLALPGVNVVVKGTAIGTSTDFDGHYAISASEGDVLVFSFLGYANQEVKVEGKELNLYMEPDSEVLNDVVVTAMGIRRDRKSLGYAISKVEGAELVSAGAPTNPVQALYGKAAGVTIRQSAAGPTGGIDINVRGAAGLEASANTRPLIVIDGAPIFDENTGFRGPNEPDWINRIDYGSGINDINAEDIASIEILKGAKASVLYGSEGANGVVLITTKTGGGANGKMSVNFSYQTTIEEPRTFLELQNEYGSGSNIYDVKDLEDGEAYPRANYNQTNFGPAFDASQQRIWWDGQARPYVAQPDNFEFMFKNGATHQINASVAKAGEFGNIRFSYTNYQYDGIVDNFSQDKNTISLSGKFNFSDRFSVETSANVYKVKTHNRMGQYLGFVLNGVQRDAPFKEYIQNGDHLYGPDDIQYDANGTPTDVFPVNNQGYLTDADREGLPTSYYALSNYRDFAWNNANNSALDDKTHLIYTIRPTYRVSDWLSLVGQASWDYTDTDFTTKNRERRVYPEVNGGYYGYRRRNTTVEEYKGLANFFNSFMDDRLDVSGLVGTAYKAVSDRSVNVSTASEGSPSGFTYPGWYHLSNQNPNGWPGYNQRGKVYGNSFGTNALYSVFGVASFTWENEYTLEINARNDWSSTLPPENNSYFYPGVAFTWDFTRHLTDKIDALKFGKFRTSWADVGRDAPSRYYAYQGYNAGTIEGTGAEWIGVPNELFLGSLKPERKREWEFGAEMTFFDQGRLSIDASYYTNHVYDQIMSIPLTPSSGARLGKTNAGDVKNWGYELQIKGTPVLTNDFRWDLTWTTANQFSEVVRLSDGITEKNVASMRGQVFVKAVEGERVGNIYGRDIARDPQGNRIVSTDGSQYVLDDNEFAVVGNVYPTMAGGFNSSMAYKGFRLIAHIDYAFGASMYSETNQWLYANGASKQSLKYRDEKNGGKAYYYDASGAAVPWEHNKPTPGGENLYHDGIVLDGVVAVPQGDGSVSYEKNTNIVPVSSYYGTFVSWANEPLNAVDLQYKNDYVKLRELSLSYTFPKVWLRKVKLEDLTINVFGRNLGYFYKTLPNLDAEAFMGTNAYFEASPTPTTRTWGMKLSVGL